MKLIKFVATLFFLKLLQSININVQKIDENYQVKKGKGKLLSSTGID